MYKDSQTAGFDDCILNFNQHWSQTSISAIRIGLNLEIVN